ncbi:hypothetical protein DVH24_014825 [Malus domestica]|uniref:Uncharacterized protein n=1 Tax=Malus domestica TaxID=3750 RepID=A0A498K202_MALDO|nr:hypothetical protein DVH24_014825 [Malus domestica]
MVKPAFSICFSNPPCLLRLADPRHRRSRLCPILLSPPSSYSSFLCLWNPSVIFLACKALAFSIETKTLSHEGFVRPTIDNNVQRHQRFWTRKKQEMGRFSARVKGTGKGGDTHPLTLWAPAPMGLALPSPPTVVFLHFYNLCNYIAWDYYFKLRFLMHFGNFEIVGNFRHNNNAQGGQSRASVATMNTKDSSIASAEHGGVQNGARVQPQLHGFDTPIATEFNVLPQEMHSRALPFSLGV